jgi:HK97 gp10 family phage protein
MSDSSGVTLKIDTAVLDRMIANSDKNARQVLEGLAYKVESQAKQNAPVQTGALRNSIYTMTKSASNFSRSITNILVGFEKRNVQSGSFNIEERPAPEGDVIATVGPSVDYGAYVELGTGKMAARPYLLPAFEAVVAAFNKGEIFKALLK